MADSQARLRSRAWLWGTVLLTAGGMAIAAALAPPGSTPPAAGLAWVLFVGSSLHVAATGWLYTIGEVRAQVRDRPGRHLWAPVGLVAGGVALWLALPRAADTWLLLTYLAWQFWHYQKQNLGLAALAAGGTAVRPPTISERRALRLAGVAGVAALLAHPGLLQLAPGSPVAGAFPLAALTYAGAVGWGLWLLWSRPAPERSGGFSAIYLMALLFFLPVFAARSPYAAVGGLTIAHGLQYLLLVGLIAGGRPARRAGNLPARRAVDLAVLTLVTLSGGSLLAAASHLHGRSVVPRLLFGAYLGVVMTHFVVDGGLWRLRDPLPRAFVATRLPWLIRDRSAADI